MGSFVDSLPRIRRLLRDPNGDIWTTGVLFRYWQQSHMELARKATLLVDAQVVPYPGAFDASFMYEWEREFLEGGLWQCWTVWQAQDEIVMYPWEAAHWMEDAGPADDGIRWMHPWEAAFSPSAVPVPFALDRAAERIRFLAHDTWPARADTSANISGRDGWYQTRTGRALTYYAMDEEQRLFALHPQPPIRFDVGTDVADVFDDAGGIVAWSDGRTDTADTGITLESLDLEGNVLAVYDVVPTVWDMDEDSPFPEPFIHYVECAVLEWAFGADTDGCIPSLRDYWKARKESGIEAMKRFQRLSLADRSVQMGASKPRRPIRGPAMPDHYPEP